jgi:hypothetical protein
MRATQKDLDKAAEELSALTKENYEIRLGHQTAKLVKMRPGTTTHDGVFHEHTNGDLLEKIVTFHAGIEEGIRLSTSASVTTQQ